MTTFTGTSGDDTLKGAKTDDIFHLEQGGDDFVQGKGGSDVFFMGGALTGADSLDGGGGFNTVVLDGDYSGGLTFTATTITNIDVLELTGGHSYSLSGLSDANGLVSIDAHDLGVDDQLTLDASALVSRGIHVTGGQGADTLTGGAGSDTFDGLGGKNVIDGGGGADFIHLSGKSEKVHGGDGDDLISILKINGATTKDKIDGGLGVDGVSYGQDTTASDQHATLVMRDSTLTGIEQLYLQGHLDVTMADGNVAPGQVLMVDATGSQTLNFDGSLETDGAFYIEGGTFGLNTLTGGAGNDIIIGGTDDDLLGGGAGDDVISGRGGGDTITGGLGQDLMSGSGRENSIDTFIFQSLAESTAEGADRIDLLSDSHDWVDVSAIDADTTIGGNQSFHLVDHLGGHSGEMAVVYDAAHDVTSFEADVNGDGLADMVIQATGDHTGFTHFVL